ncbi:hypothetical protein HHL21_08660 [Massilia sp. RP-1-19]|uniref:Uncharacterized protein n=1 Tax=Massilia polaris TaxID=2728846 RepID=A0A848HLZ9_9BURK|nr:hypothetical protein [Massilia polaris]NML61149.1 hypothetical protein [Massilia polaris]
MSKLVSRLYSDYFMPSRLPKYERFIRAAHDMGFAQTSVREFFESTGNGNAVDGRKVVVHRHDIDTDLRTARKLFELEQKYHIKSSFYFRLSTLDFGLMREIEDYGSEASYHYEELATFAKQNRIRNAAAIRSRMSEIRQTFIANFCAIEQRLDRKMTTVASHGDFANRRLKLNNTEVLNDPQLRDSCGIKCETYDQAFLQHFDFYVADKPHPQYYHPSCPFEALGKYQRICFLTHPRQFETNWVENTKDNLFRFYDGARWKAVRHS